MKQTGREIRRGCIKRKHAVDNVCSKALDVFDNRVGYSRTRSQVLAYNTMQDIWEMTLARIFAGNMTAIASMQSDIK